jgi:DNA-binding IclR family transcriptional regulator
VVSEQRVQSIERACALIAVLALKADMPLGRLSEAVDLHPATARRLLTTLESVGYVHQDAESRRYRLGPMLIYLGKKAAQQSPLHQIARIEIERLVALSGETVYTAVLDGNDVLYVDVVESTQSIRMSTHAGDRCPAYSTATGRVLLGYLPDAQLDGYLSQRFEQQTPWTETSPDRLRAVIQQVRATGVGVSVDEQEEGVTSIAAPITADEDTAIAAIAVAGPSYRLTSERVARLIPVLIESAANINAKFMPMTRLVSTAH